jgi:hypothetical protein
MLPSDAVIFPEQELEQSRFELFDDQVVADSSGSPSSFFQSVGTYAVRASL